MAIPSANGDISDGGSSRLTFFELCSKVETNDSALDFAVETEILPRRKGIDCDACMSVQMVCWTKFTQSVIPYILYCKNCKRTRSLCKNTIFSGSRVNVKQFFLNTYCWLMGLSAKEAAVQSNVTSLASLNLFTFNREVCYTVLSTESQVLGGPDQTIEVGHMTVLRRKMQSKAVEGRPKEVIWCKDTVYVGYNVDTRDMFVVKVERADLNTLLEVIMTMILPGSKVIVDDCSKYSEFAVENYDISFHEETMGTKNKCEPRRLWFDKTDAPSRSRKPSESSLLLFEHFYFAKRDLATASDKFYPFIRDLAKVFPGYGRVPLQPVTLAHFIKEGN